MAAAYTTLISYIVMALLLSIWANREFKKYITEIDFVYDNKLISVISILTLVISLFAILIYNYAIVRYAIAMCVFVDLLEGKEQHCEFDGVETVLDENGRYCCVPVTHKATLGEIVDLLEEFKSQPISLMMPKCPDGSFAKKLFSLYLTYLPTDKFKYAMKMNCDDRGSFTELVHTVDCGQVSINISKPGITKGQHWHNSKWEQFIVVHGHGLIQERNINTGETVEFEVSGDKIEAIYMIPGWTHNIINLSETEDLVTVMTCNEVFDPAKPDTFFEPV